ncbi:type III-B CRISPR module-associated protein Cmr5 [Nocardiopsis dassonvillei]|uniref:type III-B CRISPR module-associated protein Cmr5 n=1 Tax=Nocardiopsis dassonvillei TaxID=2014 RepID=UPI00157C11CC|nr:type III-B CRISPR module-associated protein Cmr5 [Nocardiopsis dassonvillei]
MREATRVDQRLARVAHDILPPQVSQELRTRMRQLPSRLRGGGLAATYAFILSKSKNDPKDSLGYAYHRLAAKIAEHVAERKLLGDLDPDIDQREFMHALSEADTRRYARVSAEVDALAVWLSRLADAYYEGPKAGEDDAREQEERQEA